MLGRVEVREIAGMVATLSLLVLAGVTVESLEARSVGRWARVMVPAPELPGETVPVEARILPFELAVPGLERPEPVRPDGRAAGAVRVEGTTGKG